MLVAVYGTLKKGYGNHHHVQGKPLVGLGTTERHYSMLNAGFPVVLDLSRAKKKQYPVQVEVYDIGDDEACLRGMDRLEGEGRMYHRLQTRVRMLDGRILTVHMYFGDLEYWTGRGRAHDNEMFLRSSILVWPSTHYRAPQPQRSWADGEQVD